MTTADTQHNTTLKKRRRKSWEKAFLSSLALTGNVSEASKAADIERSTAYDARNAYADFAEEWDTAIEIASDALEAEARRRAVDGVDEPVFQGGKEVGTVRRYSDTLLIFLLKGARPEKYRERHEHSGPNGGPLLITEIVAVQPTDGPD